MKRWLVFGSVLLLIGLRECEGSAKPKARLYSPEAIQKGESVLVGQIITPRDPRIDIFTSGESEFLGAKEKKGRSKFFAGIVQPGVYTISYHCRNMSQPLIFGSDYTTNVIFGGPSGIQRLMTFRVPPNSVVDLGTITLSWERSYTGKPVSGQWTLWPQNGPVHWYDLRLRQDKTGSSSGIEYLEKMYPTALDSLEMMTVDLAGKLHTIAGKSVPLYEGKPGVKIGDACVNPKDGAEMVWVPAGEFVMGSNDGNADEMPQRTVYLDGYWIYKCEVTVAQYRKFCATTGCAMPEEPREIGWKDDHPIVGVTWLDADAYAKWAGVSLPTEAQWEKAARGTDGRIYPWVEAWPPPAGVGNFLDESLRKAAPATTGVLTATDDTTPADYDDGYAYAAPVGSFPAGASVYGCLDMAGNVSEWCADWYASDYYKDAPARNPEGPGSSPIGHRVLRGSSWGDNRSDSLRCAHRANLKSNSRIHNFGFRCAKRAVAYKERGDPDRTVVDYDKALEIDPRDAAAYFGRGNAYFEKGDFDRAIADYGKALEIDPRLAAAYSNRGKAYFEKGDYDRAILDYDKALEITPRDAGACLGRGNAYYRKGDVDRAILDYDKALEMDPRDADVYYNRGMAYHRKGDYDRTIADCSKALEMNPRYAKAYNNRASAWYFKKEYDKAWADIKRYREAGGTPVQGLIDLLKAATGRSE